MSSNNGGGGGVGGCRHRCSMPNCSRPCALDHNSSSNSGSYAHHMCQNEHPCAHKCNHGGYCEFNQDEQQGVFLPCQIKLAPFKREHPGEHKCSSGSIQGRQHLCTAKCPGCLSMCMFEYGHEGLHDTKHGPMINSVFITNPRANSREVEIQYLHPKSKQQRSMKFFENQDGTKFTCDMYCRVLGRGHTHLVLCNHKHPKQQQQQQPQHQQQQQHSPSNSNNTGGSPDSSQTILQQQTASLTIDDTCPYDGELSLMAMGRRHHMTMSHPSRGRLIDELRHDKFWDLCGFVDPTIGKSFVTDETRKDFNLCRVTSKHKRLRDQQGTGSGSPVTNSSSSAPSSCAENYCTRHVSHDSLDFFSPNYLEEVSLLAERFLSGGLSPSGHHFAYTYAYHHYILVDCSKNMTQDDIVPSLKLFAPSTASTISSGTPDEFVKFYNRMGFSCEIILRYLHIRYKLNSQDRFTVIAFNRKTTQILIEDESTQYYYSFMDLMLANAKPNDRIGFKNGFEKLLEMLEKHAQSNTSMGLQPKVLLVSGGKIEAKKKTTSVSGVPKWHSLRLKRGENLRTLASQGKAEQVLSKIVLHLTQQHQRLYGNQYFSPEESAHFSIVRVGVEGNESRLKQFLVVGRETMTMIDCGIMHLQIDNELLLEKRGYAITLESDKQKRAELQQIASKLVTKVIGDLLLPFEMQCQLNENIKHNNGGLLVKTHMHQVDERKQQNLTEKQLKSLAERDNLAREILQTERTYVTSLAKLIELYYYPLSKYLTHVMSDGDRAKIFSGLLNIYKLHKTLIAGLEDRLSRWNDHQKIGDIFLEVSPMFMLYTQFTTKYETAIEAYNQQNKQLIGNFLYLRRKDPYTHQHTLNSFLIMPIQRIPRYKMLLEGVLKHTEESHPDRANLAGAASEMAKIADYLNGKITERQNFHKMKLISQKIVGVKDLIQPNRRYIGEFIVKHRLNSQMSEDCMLLMFNDLVLHCVQKVDELTPRAATGKRSLSLMNRGSRLTLSKSRSLTSISDNAGTDNNDIDIMGVLEDDKSGITYEARYALVLSYLQVHPLNFSKSGEDNIPRFQMQYNHPAMQPQTLEYATVSDEEKTRIVTQLNETVAEAVKRDHAQLAAKHTNQQGVMQYR